MKKQNNKLEVKRVPFIPNGKKLPVIQILAEREIKMVELDLDIQDETYAVLVQAGWETIQKDKRALASYAFAEALKEFVKQEEKNNA
jgi:hypothetical protein